MSSIFKVFLNEIDPFLISELIISHGYANSQCVSVNQVGQIEYEFQIDEIPKNVKLIGETKTHVIFKKDQIQEDCFAKKLFRKWLEKNRPNLVERTDEIFQNTFAKRAICNFEENSHVMFQLIPMVFQTLLQNKLNAKHGEYTMRKANEMIYKNNKQFQCLHLDPDLPGTIIGEHDEEGPVKYFYTDNINEKNEFLLKVSKVYCCSEKSMFISKEQFITNFVRLFHYEYTRDLEISQIDLLMLFIYIMAEMAWIYKGMINRQSICCYYSDNPVISLILGGSISFFKNFATKNVSRVYNFDGPTVNKVLHKNIQCHEIYESLYFVLKENPCLK